jgi:hypothetical protein
MKAALRIFVIAIASTTFYAPTTLGQESQISLTLTGPRAPVKVGSELWIKMVLKNGSNQSVAVTNHEPEGPGQSGPYVEVRDSQGMPAPQTEYYHSRQNGQDGSFFTDTVRLGESRQSSLLISRLYDMSRPGEYTIQVYRTFGKDTIRSNRITMTVTK